jgi:hypothetical protein
MNSQFVYAILASILSSTGGWGALQYLLSRRENLRKKTSEDKLAEHDRWLKDADKAYRRVSNDCEKCNLRLDRMSEAFYGLLEDLEDQLMPMLMLPAGDPQEISGCLRVSIRKARNTVRDVTPS